MRLSIKFSIFLSFLFLVSCSSDESSLKEYDGLKDTDTVLENSKTGECFEFILPIHYSMPDGTVLTVEQTDDKDALEQWYKDHPDVEAKAELQYPVNIFFDDQRHEVNNDQEFERFKAACEKDIAGDKSDCYEFVYPLNFTMPDGSNISISGEETDKDAIEEWYENHPDAAKEPELQFPIVILFKEKRHNIDSYEQLERFEKECDKDWDYDKEECIELIYPINYTMPDGSTISQNDEKDFEALKEWYTDHPDVDAKPEFQYPIIIIFDDERHEVNSDQELERFKAACEKDWDYDKDECLEFILPISLTMPDGSTITINELDDKDAIKEWYENHPDVEERPQIQYPIVIIFDDQRYEVDNEQQLERFREACKEKEYDCPELEVDYGDDCRKDDGTLGRITEDCTCE